MNYIDDVFHGKLRKRLAELEEEQKNKMVSGAWTAGKDAATVGARAFEMIGFWKCIQEVERICDEIAAEMHK